jgi:hypothetical protein
MPGVHNSVSQTVNRVESGKQISARVYLIQTLCKRTSPTVKINGIHYKDIAQSSLNEFPGALGPKE